METSAISNIIQGIVLRQFGKYYNAKDDFRDKSLRDFDADSLDHIEISMAIEDEFGILISDECTETIIGKKTINEIAEYIAGEL